MICFLVILKKFFPILIQRFPLIIISNSFEDLFHVHTFNPCEIYFCYYVGHG